MSTRNTSKPAIDKQKKVILTGVLIIVSLVVLGVLALLSYVGFIVVDFVLKIVLGILFAIAVIVGALFIWWKIKHRSKASKVRH